MPPAAPPAQPPTDALDIHYADAHPLLTSFILPLMRGDAVALGDPLSGEAFAALMVDLLTGSRAYGMLQLELQQRAARVLSLPPPIELHPSDVKLLAATYQVCWFFHSSVEDGRVWERRQRNLIQTIDLLLQGVAPPQDTGQAVARHMLLRHLPLVFRTDYHLDFGYFWSDLTFFGTSPKWLKLPGRSNPVIERRNVEVTQSVHNKPVADAYYRILALSPLTHVTACHRLYPRFSFWGTASTLAVPALCRYATDLLLKTGLETLMPALAAGLSATVADHHEPLSHRRYAARFVYNLILTHCLLTPPQQLDLPSRFTPQKTKSHTPQRVGDGDASYQESVAKEQQRQRHHRDGQSFHAFARALHEARGPMGALHTTDDNPDLLDRIDRFLKATPIDADLLHDARSLLKNALDWGPEG